MKNGATGQMTQQTLRYYLSGDWPMMLRVLGWTCVVLRVAVRPGHEGLKQGPYIRDRSLITGRGGGYKTEVGGGGQVKV